MSTPVNGAKPPSPVVGVETQARPTPTPVRVQFGDVLARGARGLVRGAEAAMTALPGAPMMAVAMRGGAGTSVPMLQTTGGVGSGPGSAALRPEGPGGGAQPGVGGAGEGGIESTLAQAQEQNLYYLQIQEAVNAQNRTFTTLSNVLKAEHDTVKTAIGNIR
jgi:hypothetical protein